MNKSCKNTSFMGFLPIKRVKKAFFLQKIKKKLSKVLQIQK